MILWSKKLEIDLDVGFVVTNNLSRVENKQSCPIPIEPSDIANPHLCTEWSSTVGPLQPNFWRPQFWNSGKFKRKCQHNWGWEPIGFLSFFLETDQFNWTPHLLESPLRPRVSATFYPEKNPPTERLQGQTSTSSQPTAVAPFSWAVLRKIRCRCRGRAALWGSGEVVRLTLWKMMSPVVHGWRSSPTMGKNMEQLILESQVWDLVENDGCSWLSSAIWREEMEADSIFYPAEELLLSAGGHWDDGFFQWWSLGLI